MTDEKGLARRRGGKAFQTEGIACAKGQNGTRGILGPVAKMGRLAERRPGDIYGQACAGQRRSKCTQRSTEKQWRVSVGQWRG